LPDALSVKVCWYPFYFRDDMVYIETLTAEQQLSEPDEVAVYVKAFRTPWPLSSGSLPSCGSTADPGKYSQNLTDRTSGGPAGRSRRIEPVPPATRPLTRQPSVRYIECW
jgi:hypothetical protein